jgi:F0F1-type ATP synthase epsilon subunit
MNNTFQCVVVAPPGKVIDCKATSVVFPAHDGMVGVLCDHMAMFCELGLGMMEVEYVPGDADKTRTDKAFLVIDRGFALIGENLMTIIANDAVSSVDAKKEKIERMIERLEKKLSSAAYSPDQQLRETKKIELLKNILAMCAPAPSRAEKLNPHETVVTSTE